MCFCAEASFGVAIALLPTGGYCMEAAWRKDRRYLFLAVIPILFGLQQLFEGVVWVELPRQNLEMVQAASLMYLFFGIAVWPVWVPFAVAAVEGPGWKRRALVALGLLGSLFGIIYYFPLLGGGMPATSVVGHSIRYDFSAVPATDMVPQWVWPVLYLGSVAGPLMVSRDRRLRVLGVAVILSAFLTSVVYYSVFASVWCFFAAALSGYITHVLGQLPGPTPEIAGTNPRLLPSH